MIIQLFLIIIPSIALMLISVIAYGPFWGSIIIYMSVFTASTVGFFIEKYFASFITESIIGTNIEDKIEKFINAYGFWAIVTTRLNPFLSNDAISFVAGILKIRYLKFMGATLLGITPLIILIAATGGYMDKLKTVLLWVSIMSVISFIGYLVYQKINTKYP